MKTKLLLMFLMSVPALLFLKPQAQGNLLPTIKNFTYSETRPVNHMQTSVSDECGQATYEDVNGLIIIEAENLAINGTNWNVKTEFEGYTGYGYLSWDGNNNFNSPGNGLISTTLKINTPGTYRFRWHSKVGNGSNSTEHNDSWLRFPDASDFYGEINPANRLKKTEIEMAIKHKRQ